MRNVFLRARAGARPQSSRPAAELLESRELPAVMVPSYVRFRPAGGVVPLSSGGPTGTSPSRIRHAYGFDQITFANGTVVGDGSGTTIAIVDAYDDPNIANDLKKFDQTFGLPDPTFTKVNEYGGTSMPAANGGWVGEIALDVEWAHAIAPRANILLVEADSAGEGDLFQAVRYAAGAPGVVSVSMSWAGGEFNGESSFDSNTFVTPAGHGGVTFLAAAGDSGAPAVYPSASPNVVSVGGTTLSLDGSGNILGETAWSGSGGGLSTYEAQPYYQKGVVTQSGTQRATPDVAYDSNPATGFPVYDSYNNGTAAPWVQYGGTSDAAPQWAALIAIADQGRALNGLPSLNGATQTLPALYQLPAGDFHDVTSGTTTGSPNESAGPGFDLATGRGSPVANLIVNALAVYGAPPRVVAAAPVTDAQGGVTGVTFTFSEAIAAFTTAAVVSVSGPGGTVTPTGVTALSSTQYEVTFASQKALGNYAITIGPNIKDLAGDSMDQNGNHVAGEVPGDEYTTTFGLPAPVSVPVQETFADGVAHGFVSQSGGWSVQNGSYQAAPAYANGDALSILALGAALPVNAELDVTMTAPAASGGYYSNGFLIFDYQSPTSFKFAGTFVGMQTWVIGHRDANGWENDVTVSDPAIAAGTGYGLQLLLQGDSASLLVGGIAKAAYTYLSSFTGSVGLGTANSQTQFNNLAVMPGPGAALPYAENFADGTAHYFVPQQGGWAVSGGRYGSTPVSGGDTLTAFTAGAALPSNLALAVTMNAPAASGYYSNGFVIFDYQSPTNFKFAGAFVGNRQWVIGHRDAIGWHNDVTVSDTTLATGTDYNLQLVLQGVSTSLVVNGTSKASYTYATGFTGLVGLGTENSLTQFGSLSVQQGAGAALPYSENFADGQAHNFAAQSGGWAVSSGRYASTPVNGGDALTQFLTAAALPASLEFDVTMNAAAAAGSYYSNGFLIFDYQGPNNFKYAGAFVGLQQWVVGHRDATGWHNDATVSDATIAAGTDYNLQLVLQGGVASLLVNGVNEVGFTYSSAFTGALGLGSSNSVTQFANLTVKAHS